jgi:hypothetical protein
MRGPLLAMAAATGGSGSALARSGIEVSDETAAAISALSSLKSRYTNDAWLAPAQALNDPLRHVTHWSPTSPAGATPPPRLGPRCPVAAPATACLTGS